MTPGLGRIAKGGAAGATVSASLWAADLFLTSKLRFAGADDPAAQERVVDLAHRSIVTLEVELFLVFVVFGLVLGAMTVAARTGFRRNRTDSARGGWVLAAAVTLLAHVLTLFAMVGRYPQLYADRWWLAGGALATLQRVVTHVIGPFLFDLLFVGLMLVLVLGMFLWSYPSLRVTLSGRVMRWAAIAAGLALIPLGLYNKSQERSADAPPNVLILCLDSLRSDRLGAADVMPFSSSLISSGSLYRFAFTPIARTYPSWVSILTGSEPRRHGIRTMFPSRQVRRDIGPTFISVLRDSGYRTFVVSDFAGDIFHGFEAGFETIDTPELNVDTLAQSTVLNAHTWALPLIRSRFLRNLFPVWRNQPSIADPDWLARGALSHIERDGKRPFAGVVFFSTAHFPYSPPHPYYARNSQSYRGPYLYHVPQNQAGRDLEANDVKQMQALYDAALTSVDQAMAWLIEELGHRGLREDTIIIIMGDHGEELYDRPGVAGHGDFVDAAVSQSVPILLLGPGISPGKASNRQVRLYDLGATVLDLVGLDGSDAPGRFGDGVSLRLEAASRPICVETGIWFFPTLPAALRGERLEYPGIAELLDIDSRTREMVLRPAMEEIVETAKQRGVVLGSRIWSERLTPQGLVSGMTALPGIQDEMGSEDLKRLFEERCVDTDPRLRRFFGAVVYQNAVR